MESTQKPVHVIGGGYSGLTVAYYLVRAGYQVTVFEKSQRLGGLLGTHHGPFGLTEQAANAFLATAELEKISRDIKVPLLAKKKTANNRYIFFNGRPRRWPVNFSALFHLAKFASRYYWARQSLKPTSGESLEHWAQRHLGAYLSRVLVGPAMQGVYVAQPHQLSATLLLRDLFLPPQAQGQLRGSVAPALGMEQWIEGLRNYLLFKGAEIKTECDVNLSECALPTVLATDLYSAQKMLSSTPYFTAIHEASTVDITSVTIHLAPDQPRAPAGFGCLFPKQEGFNSLGVLYNNDIFPGRTEEALSETWIFANATRDTGERAQNIFLQQVNDDRQRLVGRAADIKDCHLFQWPNAIPLYNPTLEKILIELEGEEGNIFLMGNYLGQLGLSKIIRRAQSVVERIKEKGQWQDLA